MDLRQCREAIEKQLVLRFDYQGHDRIVVPAAVGSDVGGREKLRGFQIGGSSSKGVPDPSTPRLFFLDLIGDGEVTEDRFEIPPWYRRGDSGFHVVWAEL